MGVSFFSGSFLKIIDLIFGKIQIITPHQRFFYIYKKKKKKNLHTVKNRYTKHSNNDQNIVNDQQL